MITIPNKYLDQIETSSSSVFIKEVCQIIEDVDDTSLIKTDALKLIKKLLKKKVYESSRNRVALMKTFTHGFKYSEINLQ